MDRTRGDNYPLDRRDVVAELVQDQEDLLVITGLGAPTWDVTAAGDRDLTFPLWGAMGGAAAIGLGLAVTQPERRVLVITGDGEMLMGLGLLATIGVQGPDNLAITVIDNERYGETGMQATHTAGPVDFAGDGAGRGLSGDRDRVRRRCFTGRGSSPAPPTRPGFLQHKGEGGKSALGHAAQGRYLSERPFFAALY